MEGFRFRPNTLECMVFQPCYSLVRFFARRRMIFPRTVSTLKKPFGVLSNIFPVFSCDGPGLSMLTTSPICNSGSSLSLSELLLLSLLSMLLLLTVIDVMEEVSSVESVDMSVV